MGTVKKFVVALTSILAAETIVWLTNKLTEGKENGYGTHGRNKV